MSSQPSSGIRRWEGATDKVYLMGTCLVDSFYPDAGMDAIRLLQQLGIEVIFPQNQTCCGQPPWNSGYEEEARKVARQQLAAFAEPIPVLVMMGSCAGMVHLEYPTLFAGQPEQAEAEALAARTFEWSEFLVDVLKVEFDAKDNGQANDQPTRVALHVSCSSRRGMGIASQHESLIERLPNVELVLPERATECCGFGGTFAVKQGDISAAMADDKARAMAATGAAVLTSADCGCLMNIGGTLDVLAQRGDVAALPYRHIASLVTELGGKPRRGDQS